nr:hypothetical protein [Tanacetum cinerariifolium]
MNFIDLSFLSTFLRKKESGGNMQITSTEWRCCSQSTYVRVDNFIQNSEHEYSESEDSNFDNPPVSLPPPEPPDKEFDFKIEISVVMSVIVKFDCIDARVKFDVFSLLSADSEDAIFDPGISD